MKNIVFSSAFTILVSSAAVFAGNGNPVPHAFQHAGKPANPADALGRRIKQHLREGRIEQAVRAAQESIARFPDHAGVRREFIALHISLARSMIAEENFATAEQALRSVLKVDDDHAEARRLIGVIDSAREQVPRHVEQAKEWIDLEWFEPAFNTLRQAGTLRPTERHAWARSYREASIGAGDDHYFTKTFHEAFYYYDAAVKLGEELEFKPSPSLTSRWMQCMVHALADDINRAQYPPAYWKLALKRADLATVIEQGGSALHAMLRGLAYENMGMPTKAAAEYGHVLGRPVVNFDADLVARSRMSALHSLRGLYDVRLSQRREGVWSKGEAGDWQVLESPGFRVHHHNTEAAQRVAKALRFHFARIADLMSLDPQEVPWAVACDVHLYVDNAEFNEATRQPEHVRAVSNIRSQGRTLQGHAIHAIQTDPMLLSASLPHELAHLMVGAVTDYRPFKAVMNEGIALKVEPQCRQRQFARLFAGIGRPNSVSKLLGISDVHPPTADFYAEAYRLMTVLLERGDMATVLEAGLNDTNRRKLARTFEFKSGSALEQSYRGKKE